MPLRARLEQPSAQVAMGALHHAEYRTFPSVVSRVTGMSQSATLPHACDRIVRAIGMEEVPVTYYPRFREYGIWILDGGTSVLTIEFCPFCGLGLPPSTRDQWFDSLEALGLELEDDLPDEMRSDQWWRNAEG